MTSRSSLTHFFQSIKDEIPFSQVFQQFTQIEMRRQGRFFVALCPFHQERIPSFTIYDNGFKCFGCGESGDSVAFVSKLYGVRPLEAARLIAGAFGLSFSTPLSAEKRKEIKAIERERQLRAAFMVWERATFSRLVGFRNAIRRAFEQEGLDSDPGILGIMHYMPEIEYCIETLAIGSESDKVALFKRGVI